MIACNLVQQQCEILVCISLCLVLILSAFESAVCSLSLQDKREVRAADGSQAGGDHRLCGGEGIAAGHDHAHAHSQGLGVVVEVKAAVLIYGEVLRVVKELKERSLKTEKERLQLRVARVQGLRSQRRIKV